MPHMDAAYNLACWLLRDTHEAEDAVQDSCVRANGALGGFRGGDGRPWLLKIVRNVCYSRLRKGKRGPEQVAFDDELHGSAAESGEAAAVDWKETRGELLDEALGRLPEEYREVVVLHELEGMAYREIAGVAGIPIGTVMSRLSRGRARLQRELLSLKGGSPA